VANLEQYLKHVSNNGPDMILETAARDSDVTDAEYADLVAAAIKASTRGKQQNHAKRLRDRAIARVTT
jgi:hypothetical protein